MLRIEGEAVACGVWCVVCVVCCLIGGRRKNADELSRRPTCTIRVIMTVSES